MPSIIEGYSYDIFISYRQKDNKGERWVSEFVEALKTELESTFKEEISVYFDSNPHDGLLDTYDVDASLKDKLKCLIFIPIISRTYCDPKSFAWEHEFKAFVALASQDQFGLKVKLPSGNVANRVLPVRIHDLDAADIRSCESILGGHLRGIEFIYKEPGVNKPLKPEDNEKKNLNNTKFSIQINKVALAIKEIISGLNAEPVKTVNERNHLTESPKEVIEEEKKSGKRKAVNARWIKIFSIGLLIALFITAAIFAYPQLFRSFKSEIAKNPDKKMSIVVNTFDNKTGDASMDHWSDIIPDLLRGYLATSKELSVQNSQIMFEVYESIRQVKNASFSLSQSKEAAVKLKADSYIMGSFQKIKDGTLIVVNLINTKSGEVLFTKSIEGNLDTEYIELMNSLSGQIKNFLEIKALEQSASKEYKEAFTSSAAAYRKYIEGMKFIMNGDFPIAAKTLEEAYRMDTTFTLAAFFCSFAYCNFDQGPATYWEQKAYPGKEKLTEDYRMWLEFWHGWFTTKNIDDIQNYCNSIEKSDSKSRFILFDIGVAYIYLKQYDKSISMFKKVETVSAEWGENWKYRDFYIFFTDACHLAGNFSKEARVLKTGLELFPDDKALVWAQARLALSKRNDKKGTEYINKYEYLCKRSGVSESEIKANTGSIYEEAGLPDEAEEYYRQAVALEPENAYWLNKFAYLLINSNRNIDEGLKLVNKALELRPDGYSFYDTKGWAFYKLGKYKEAMEMLQKSWDLAPFYWNEAYFHIQEANKAIANNK